MESARADAVAIELAPYAVVRLAALPYPGDAPAAAHFRTVMNELTALHTRIARIARIAPALADALYRSATGHGPDFHRKVVLPLRRDVHNGRVPRPATIAALDTLPDRVPGLAAWLQAHRDLARLADQAAATAGTALTAERELLAQLCRAEALRRAVTLTGHDLLHGVDRIAEAAGWPDARARKAEATVLRYALRASAKTSPLSWYTHIAWGRWCAPREPDDPDGGTPVALTQANRVLLTRLITAVLTDRNQRDRLPHRLAPGVRSAGGRVRFRRDTTVGGVSRALAVREEEVELSSSGPLSLLISAIEAAGPGGVTPADLAKLLAERLPPAEAQAAAVAYVSKMLDAGLLVAVQPVHPQHPDAVAAVADWLDEHAHPRLAGLLRTIRDDTAGFTALPPADRPEALSALGERWRVAGEAAGTDLTGATPLTEDVALPRQLRLGPGFGRDAAAALPLLAGFAEVFDQQLLVRRMLRDRFVQRYGEGGHADPAEFAGELGGAWKQAGLIGMDGTISDAAEIGPEVRELAQARTVLTAAATAGEPGTLPRDVVAAALDVLPRWALARPVSYSFFAQPVTAMPGTGLVLNHVYAGFGRFASRFLTQLGATARDAVAAQLRRVFPEGTLAQFRPVGGFNANLHPLVAPREVGEDAAWADIAAQELQVCHDPATDQLRLRLRATGASVDVLYLGFLAAFMLPDRMAPLHGDLACGLVSLSHLAPAGAVAGVATGGRLHYEQIMLARRTWRLTGDVVAELRADLATGADVPGSAVARWRARLGLPERVFLGPADATVRSPQDFQRYAQQPKPQYADLGNALHLRCLARLLARHHDGALITEALPAPGPANPAGRVTELIIETYRRAR